LQLNPDKADEINNTFNGIWLRTEKNHVTKAARSAVNWEKYEKDSELFPYLEYMPSTAAEPDTVHRQFWGIVLPLNHPFWDEHLPPSRWGCQCSVKQRSDNKNATALPENLPKPPKGLEGNPYKTGKVFSPNHPFIAKASEARKQSVEKEWTGHANKYLRDYTKDFLKPLQGKNLVIETPEKGKINTIINSEGLSELLNQPAKNDKFFVLMNLENALKDLSFVGEAPYEPDDKSKLKGDHRVKIQYYRFGKTGMILNVAIHKSGLYKIYSLTDDIRKTR
jgi:hypothetical protein